MNGIQTQNGKAFEYACLKAVRDVLQQSHTVEADENAAYQTAKSSYEKLSSPEQGRMYAAARSATKILLALEPILKNGNGSLLLRIQSDSKGRSGDVRDVLFIRRSSPPWEIGISCKHNHDAVKHSRISPTIDFGKEWFDSHCSPFYFEKINFIFSQLENFRKTAESSGSKILWREVPNKEDSVYIPILKAFASELRRLSEIVEDAAQKFVSYLIGVLDFYKITMDDKNESTRIQPMNFSGSLNQNFKSQKARISIGKLKFPTRFLEIAFKKKSKTTLNVTLDEGWSFSLRIHSASAEVEPSLKFDIKMIGVPGSALSIVEPWESKISKTENSPI